MMFLSSSHWPGQPVSGYRGARTVFSESLLWDLPRYYPQGFTPRLRSQMSPSEQDLLDRVAHVMRSEKPDVVVVDDRSDKDGFGEQRPFDYLTYFRQDARFAEEWQRYSLRAQLGPFQVYHRN